jgi:hypothetical protein
MVPLMEVSTAILSFEPCDFIVFKFLQVVVQRRFANSQGI